MPEQSDFTSVNSRLNKCELTPRVAHLRQAYFDAMPEICIERPYHLTKFSKPKANGSKKLRSPRTT